MTFSDAEYAQDGPTIALTDDSRRSPLVCQIEQVFEIQGQQYALLLPLDNPIEIFGWEADELEETESLVDIDEEELEALLPLAKAVLAEQNLSLQDTAITLTVAGELPEPTEDQCFTLTQGEGEDEEDGEEFQVLATFYQEGLEYTVCTPVNPLLLFAHLTAEGKAQVVSPEEFERLRPEFESTIFDVLED